MSSRSDGSFTPPAPRDCRTSPTSARPAPARRPRPRPRPAVPSAGLLDVLQRGRAAQHPPRPRRASRSSRSIVVPVHVVLDASRTSHMGTLTRTSSRSPDRRRGLELAGRARPALRARRPRRAPRGRRPGVGHVRRLDEAPGLRATRRQDQRPPGRRIAPSRRPQRRPRIGNARRRPEGSRRRGCLARGASPMMDRETC